MFGHDGPSSSPFGRRAGSGAGQVANDDDRAGRVADDVTADRAEQRGGQAAAAVRADDHEVGTLGRADERIAGRSLHERRLDRDAARVHLPDRLVEHPLRRRVAPSAKSTERSLDGIGPRPGSLIGGGGTNARACTATTVAARSRASATAHSSAARPSSEPSTPTTIRPADRRKPTKHERAGCALAPRRGRPAPPAPQHDLVAVLEKRARRAVRQRERLGAVQVSSINDPSVPCPEPEIVPDAIRSPVRTEAPLLVACASCWGNVQ